MIKKHLKKINIIILVAVFLCAAFPLHASAAQMTGTTYVTGGTAADHTSYQLRYGHYTQVRSNGTPDDENVAGSYNHYLEFVVPIDLRSTYDCYYNGDFKQQMTFTLNMSGSSLYSTIRNYTIQFEPNSSVPSEQLLSTAYSSSGAANGYVIWFYMIANNFQCAAGQSQQIGTFTFRFWLSSPLSELTGISLDLTVADSSGSFDIGGTYEVGSGMTGQILKAIDYSFATYSQNEFLRDVHAYLFGMDTNLYDINQILNDIYDQDLVLYNYLVTQLPYIETQLRTANDHLLNIRNNFMAKYNEMLAVLIQIRDGPSETDAEAELGSAAERLESAGAQLEIDRPNIDGNLNQLDGIISDPNIAAAQGTLFAWISNGFIFPIIVVSLILGVLGFVLYGKH